MQLKRGALVKIKGVYGHMTAPHNSYSVVTTAGGIGVTPHIGLFGSLLPTRKGYLIWSLHDHHAFNFQSELQHLTTIHPQVKMIYYFTKKEGHLNQR